MERSESTSKYAIGLILAAILTCLLAPLSYQPIDLWAHQNDLGITQLNQRQREDSHPGTTSMIPLSLRDKIIGRTFEQRKSLFPNESSGTSNLGVPLPDPLTSTTQAHPTIKTLAHEGGNLSALLSMLLISTRSIRFLSENSNPTRNSLFLLTLLCSMATPSIGVEYEFKIINEHRQWPDNNEQCMKEYGGHLASVKSDADHEALKA